MSTDTDRKRAQKDQLARERAVRGRAFRLRGESEKPAQFIMNHWAIHQDATGKCTSCRNAGLWTADQKEAAAIKVFLAGGPCPEEYKRIYALAREQLGLPGGRGRDGD
jgi:hypothetical protein